MRLKDGSTSSGKRILIYGKQRVTALMAGLLGNDVLTKDFDTVSIRIAFHPVDERFELSNPEIRKDVAWIPDLAEVFAPDASLTELTDEYTEKNPDADRRKGVARLGTATKDHQQPRRHHRIGRRPRHRDSDRDPQSNMG